MPRKAKKVEEVEEEEEEEEAGSGVFNGMVFAVSGKLSVSQSAFRSKILDNGGEFAGSVTKKVTHLVTTLEEIAAPTDKISKAKENNIFIVSEEFVDSCIAQKKAVSEADYVLGGQKRAAAEPAEAEPPAKKAKIEKAEAPPAPAEPEKKEKITVKGRAAVDKFVPNPSKWHVYEDGNDVYDCMLNQTNIKNNNNKFYVIQVLESDTGGSFAVWNRWGRVGEPGQNKFQLVGSFPAAKRSFEKKYSDKTRNQWASRSNFRPVPGKYTLIKIDYGADAVAEEEKKPVKKATGPEKESTLDPRIQQLIKLIFDIKMMERVMTEMEFDIKKQPLGKLTKDQIKDGYQVLKELEAELNGHARYSVLEELSSRFYTLIPHVCGRVRPPVINNQEMLKKKIQLVEALADVEIAAKIIKDAEGGGDSNRIDESYKKLNTEMKPVDQGTEEWELVQKYVTNTHPRSTPPIKNVFRIDRQGEAARFEASKALGNRKLLWHGSRLTNFVGIISQGLRIAPPEAPASGYRFGKGLYFADICQLASRYCRTQGNSDFIMLLVDVSLGKTADLAKDQYMEKALPGSDSTKALGTQEPDPKDYKTILDGCAVPFGKIVDSGFKGVSCVEHQYIVYSVGQANIKYLIQFGP